MPRPLDIFKLENDGSIVWKGTAETLEIAKLSVKMLAKTSPGEKRTGLLRCYISRVENGHTVPAIETLKRWHALSKCLCIACFMTVKCRRVEQAETFEG